MATTINKQRVLNQLLANVPTEEDGKEADAAPRPVLEQFIYGLCRENATPEQADRAYANLAERFFDWNEVRVSSIRELEEAMEGLSDTESRAQRLVSFLQEVFEDSFSFDLEGIAKKGLKAAAKKLSDYQAADDYLVAWVVQRSLGGHAIPVDQPTLRCARRLGLIDASTEEPEQARASLEHLVGKSKGPAFTDAISVLAAEPCYEPEPECGGCPMADECPSAQEVGGEVVGAGRVGRTKPR